MRKKKKLEKIILTLVFAVFLVITSYFNGEYETNILDNETSNYIRYDMSNIPEYNGEIYIEINNNIPSFTPQDLNIKEDYYSYLKDGKVRNGNDKNKL